jgi:hypothetical protein
MPGVQIPWNGPMSIWTKRDAFVATSLDTPSIHAAAPIQASFSIWINNPESRDIINEWMALSADRQMISDDPSKLGFPELPDFYEHRHDQSLLSLVCLKRGLLSIDLGSNLPNVDSKHPSEVAKFLRGKRNKTSLKGQLIEQFARVIERLEWLTRKWVKFNEPQARPDAPPNKKVPSSL